MRREAATCCCASATSNLLCEAITAKAEDAGALGCDLHKEWWSEIGGIAGR